MAINVISVQYNGESFPDIISLTQGYYHWVTYLNAMKRLYFLRLFFSVTIFEVGNIYHGIQPPR